MFGVMCSKLEIVADGTEDVLLKSLSSAMRARGFNLLGVIALQDADGSIATFGDVEITQSLDFGRLLRCLADQIELNHGETADAVIPSA
jgi:hypothetical protein